MMRYFFAFIVLCSSIISCTQKTRNGDLINTDDDDFEEQSEVLSDITDILDSEVKMIEIENIPSEELFVQESLDYEKEGGYAQKAIAYFNKNQEIVKATQFYRNGEYKNNGERSYFFDSGKLIAYTDLYEDWKDTNTVYFSEKRTFIENDEVVRTEIRSANEYEKLFEEGYMDIRLENVDLSSLNAVLNAEGVYKPYFVDIIEAQGIVYLLLGEPNVDVGYFSTVRIDEYDDFTKDLILNKDKYLNRPISVQFRRATAGFTYQQYIPGTGEWLDFKDIKKAF